jgi:hypothetical protein
MNYYEEVEVGMREYSFEIWTPKGRQSLHICRKNTRYNFVTCLGWEPERLIDLLAKGRISVQTGNRTPSRYIAIVISYGLSKRGSLASCGSPHSPVNSNLYSHEAGRERCFGRHSNERKFIPN